MKIKIILVEQKYRRKYKLKEICNHNVRSSYTYLSPYGLQSLQKINTEVIYKKYTSTQII